MAHCWRTRWSSGRSTSGLSTSLTDGLALEQEAFVEVFRTDDSQVGVQSFLEHGPGKATFTGR